METGRQKLQDIKRNRITLDSATGAEKLKLVKELRSIRASMAEAKTGADKLRFVKRIKEIRVLMGVNLVNVDGLNYSPINIDDDQAKLDWDKAILEADGNDFEAAKNVYQKVIQGHYVETKIGRVFISGLGWQEIKSGLKNDNLRAKIIPYIVPILKGGNVGTLEPLHKERKDDITGFYPFTKTVSIEDRMVTVLLKVAQKSKGEFVYHLRPFEGNGTFDSTKENASLLRVLPDSLAFPGSASPTLDSILDQYHVDVNLIILKVTDLDGNEIKELEDISDEQPMPELSLIPETIDPLAAAKARIQTEEFKKIQLSFAHDLGTIRSIDAGTMPGYTRSLFVSSLTGKLTRLEPKDPLLVALLLAWIFDAQKSFSKPAIATKNSVWNLVDFNQYLPLFVKDEIAPEPTPALDTHPEPTPAPETKTNTTRAEAGQAMTFLADFIGRSQLSAMKSAMAGEEAQYFFDKVVDLQKLIQGMPHTYQTDGQGNNAIAYLHYFKGSGDWYITEKDMGDGSDNEQIQAFGLADLGHGGETGYISIKELIGLNVELDLYWTPKTLSAINGGGSDEVIQPPPVDTNHPKAQMDQFTAELDALQAETDIAKFDIRLDEIVERIEAAGLMDALDGKLNETADALTALMAEAEKNFKY